VDKKYQYLLLWISVCFCVPVILVALESLLVGIVFGLLAVANRFVKEKYRNILPWVVIGVLVVLFFNGVLLPIFGIEPYELLSGIALELTGVVFVLWNLVPVVIGGFLIRGAISCESSALLGGCVGYVLCGIGFVLFINFSWIFDWNTMKTGSSTSGLVFIFLPFYSLMFGAIGY